MNGGSSRPTMMSEFISCPPPTPPRFHDQKTVNGVLDPQELDQNQ